MTCRVIGLALLNVTGVLVIGGSLYDLLVPSVPANHLAYLGAVDGQLEPRYAELDLAMLRSIGGCLLAIGVTALVLANGPIRGEGWARVTRAVFWLYNISGSLRPWQVSVTVQWGQFRILKRLVAFQNNQRLLG